MITGNHGDNGYVEAVEKFNPVTLEWEDTGIENAI